MNRLCWDYLIMISYLSIKIITLTLSEPGPRIAALNRLEVPL
jgi:hypothetical protein